MHGTRVTWKNKISETIVYLAGEVYGLKSHCVERNLNFRKRLRSNSVYYVAGNFPETF